MDFVSGFDDRIRSRSLLTHYFYAQKWNKGELSADDLRTYAKEYYHLVRNVPVILEAVKKRAIERGIETNLIDENLAEEYEHVTLWERFGKSLGLNADDLRSHEPTSQTAEAVSGLRKLAEGTFEDGVAVMYALELDLPAIAESKKDGLCEHYALESEDAHVYFDEHLNEEEHLKLWRTFPIDASKAADVVDETLSLQHTVLDGVCDACGIETDC